MAPVLAPSIMIGRTLGGATVSLLQGLIVVVICLIAGFRPASSAALPLALLFMALIAVMFTALGTAIASVLQDFQGFQLMMDFLVMPMFFLSGALFPLAMAPKALRIVAAFDPFSYGVDSMRAALAGGVSHYGGAVDMLALWASVVALVGLGTWLFSRIQL